MNTSKKKLSKPLLNKIVALTVLALVIAINVMPIFDINSKSGQVLAYATNISVAGLNASTNAVRANGGLAAYNLNSQLNSAAQAKANHMIANNYWAHIAPDGTTPWYFISASGYQYSSAGENLAYGFNTSADTVNGWYNSSAHYANLMSSTFTDVGYGIANGDFQGGKFTVVVSMYGQPLNPPTTPEPAPQPAPTETANPTQNTAPEQQTQINDQQPVETPLETANDQPSEELTPEQQEEAAAKKRAQEETAKKKQQEEAAAKKRAEAEAALKQAQELPRNITPVDQGEVPFSIEVKSMSNLEALMQGHADITLYVSVVILISTLFFYVIQHVSLFRKTLELSSQDLKDHPMLETTVIIVALAILLGATFGYVL